MSYCHVFEMTLEMALDGYRSNQCSVWGMI